MYRTVIECEDGFFRSTAENEAMPTFPDPDARGYATPAEAAMSHSYGDPVEILANYLDDHQFPHLKHVLQVPHHHWRVPVDTKLPVLHARWKASDCTTKEREQIMRLLSEMYNQLSCEVSKSNCDWSVEYGHRARAANEWAHLYKLIGEREEGCT